MNRQGKSQLKELFADKLSKSNAVILAEYRGLTVEEVTDLRVKLRQVDAEFKVVKNRIAKKAIEAGFENMKEFSDKFVGPVAMVCAYGDSAQATKTVLEF